MTPILLLSLLLAWSTAVWAAPKNANGSNSETPVSSRCVSSDGTTYVACGDMETTIAGEDVSTDVMKVEERFGYTNITTATTTVVKSGVGFLHAITVNTTAAGAITIYDNTSGAGNKIGTIKASVGEQTFIYNVAFSVGLTIVTAGASDITVSSR